MHRKRGSSKSNNEATGLTFSLGKKLNPRFSLDLDNLPPAYTLQILLEDDFDQIIEATELTEKDNVKTAETTEEPPHRLQLTCLVSMLLLMGYRPAHQHSKKTAEQHLKRTLARILVSSITR